jgi:hypothetical protein
MAELLRCSNADWERINRELEELLPASRSSTTGHISSSFEQGSDGASLINSEKNFGSGGVASLKGAVRRYYQSGLSRHSPSASGASQIPFNWFGSVPFGREQIVESALVIFDFLYDFNECNADSSKNF